MVKSQSPRPSSSTASNRAPIAVLGAGSWGTALALQLARVGNAVRLWGLGDATMASMQAERENKQYLPHCIFPDSINASSDLAATLRGVTDVLIVIPSRGFVDFLPKIKAAADHSLRIAWGTKGLDFATGDLLQQRVADLFGETTPMAVLSGPSFATELAQGLPTAVSLAANNSDFRTDLIERLHGDTFRIYENADLIGVQLCGVLKNVIAIAVGICDGLSLGANARCALITRALVEMQRFCVARGGRAETALSLAGVGDLVLTCTDNQSRNRRFGLAIGSGLNPEQAAEKVGRAIEGYTNADQVFQWSQRLKLSMPICEQVYKVLYQAVSPKQVLAELLERAPKVEC